MSAPGGRNYTAREQWHTAGPARVWSEDLGHPLAAVFGAEAWERGNVGTGAGAWGARLVARGGGE